MGCTDNFEPINTCCGDSLMDKWDGKFRFDECGNLYDQNGDMVFKGNVTLNIAGKEMTLEEFKNEHYKPINSIKL